jgi:7-cyano-7-deazaguanine synthase
LAATKKAVVLLSGGLDSATTLAVARKNGYEVFALSFDYGQRHGRELQGARKIASFFDVGEHLVLKIPLGELGGSALTDKRIHIPSGKGPWREGASIPATYVPGRNLILLSFAAAYAEVLGAEAVFIGANALDYSGYPDCRPEFLRRFERTVAKGTRRGVSGKPLRIIAPLLHLSKADIVRLGASLGVPFLLTWSCYRGGKRPCGRCDSCLIRAKGFAEAKMKDPLIAVGVRGGKGARVQGGKGARVQGGKGRSTIRRRTPAPLHPLHPSTLDQIGRNRH